MTLKIGDIISVIGCGATNICKTCKSTCGCASFVEGELILARVVEIHRHTKNCMEESPMDRVAFYPLKCSAGFDYETNYTRRKWCKLAKTEAEHVMEILF